MLKAIFGIVSAATVIGAVLIPTAASAAVTAPAETGPPVDTTVTFAVGSGDLTITGPTALDLGSGLPGDTLTNTMGTTLVTDNRAALAAAWTVTASSTDFTSGGNSPDEIIPASAATFDPGPLSGLSGNIVPIGTAITLQNGPQTVVDATGVGDNSVSWDATLTLVIPAAAVTGSYAGTLTQSVS